MILVDSVDEALRRNGGLGALGVHLPGLSKPAAALLHEQVATAVTGALDINLVELLAKAWAAHGTLREAAKETLAEPGTTKIVDLATHRVTAAFRPIVDITVNGPVVAQLTLELSVTLDIVGLAGAVSAGRLVALRGGECHATAKLTAAGIDLLTRQQTLDLTILVPLGSGLPLVHAG